MLKKVLISGLFCLSIATTANANGYDLATNMKMLASTFLSVQEGFLSNDKASTLVALDKFQKEVDDLLGDKRNIERLLPEDLKHKASMATNTATLMDKYVNEIREDLNDKDMSMIDRQNKTPKIFLNIEGQCFRCHNMVRDWE
jgi:hypothetical protein